MKRQDTASNYPRTEVQSTVQYSANAAIISLLSLLLLIRI